MRTFLKISVVLTFFVGTFCAACQSETSRKVQNIETFALIYGYARWFHPSDEAQQIDWEKFAILGVQKVEKVKSTEELRDTLLQLFSPIVQGLQIYETNKPDKINSDILLSPDINAKPVAWQHHGVYLNEKFNIYKSARTNKDINTDAAVICKVSMNPSHLLGKEVKFSGYFKNKSQNKESAKLFIQYILQNDNKTHDTVIESVDWKTMNMRHCEIEVTDKDSHLGKYSLKLSFDFTGKMFDRMPQLGENISESIGNNLTCVIPLVYFTSI